MSPADYPDDPLVLAAEQLPPELFAVVDGGKFDSIDEALASVGLKGQPLYLEGADPGARAAAGHLVALPERRDLIGVVALAKPLDALVIWSWPSGLMSLYRHLRTLNLVEIPNEARAEAEADGEDVSELASHEPVLFRHWDPSVLATLLPLLEPPQQARILGAANAVALYYREHSCPMVTARPVLLPAPAPGMLRMSGSQMARIEGRRITSMAGRVESYLRSYAAQTVAQLAPRDIHDFCRRTVSQGVGLGIEQEGAHCRWAYLQLMTGERVLDAPGVRQMFADDAPGVSIDDRVRILFAAIADEQAGRI
jgi:hypothetical protein